MKINELKTETKSKLSPLYKLERKTNLKPLIIFSLLSAVVLFIVIALFPFLDDAMLQLQEIFEGNEEMQNMLSVAIGTQNITTYFVAQAAQSWALVGAIYGAYLGYKLICGNFKDGSYEILYTQNLSRTQILKHKFLRLIINLLIFSLVNTIVGLVALLIWGYGEFNVFKYFLYALLVTLMTLQTGVLSFALATFAHKKYSVMTAMLIVVATYFIITFALSVESLEFLKCFTPFTIAYLDVFNATIKTFEIVGLIAWTVVPTILAFLGVKSYKNTDLM